MSVIPLIILTKDRPRMFKDMMASIESVTDMSTCRIIVVDNASTCPVMQKYLKELENKYQIVRNVHNFGIAGVNYAMDLFQSDYFLVSDPDIQLNKDTPKDWVLKFRDVLSTFSEVNKVGAALNISFSVDNKITDAVRQWEGKYWTCPMSLMPVIEDVAYSSNIDTTLCMYRSSYYRNKNNLVRFFQTVSWPAVRVAGRYTAEHLGWDVYGKYEDDVRYYSKTANLGVSGTTKFLMDNVYGA